MYQKVQDNYSAALHGVDAAQQLQTDRLSLQLSKRRLGEWSNANKRNGGIFQGKVDMLTREIKQTEKSIVFSTQQQHGHGAAAAARAHH